jgi:enamine deaminase RidA (YjgF/YER057c/UK114 family)
MSAGAAEWGKEVLLEDERGRGDSAVVRFGPYLFLSGSDGDHSAETEEFDLAFGGDPMAQVRNSYGRIQRRLERCGYDGRAVVWLEHFVSSQDWLLLRLSLWREYFGLDLCTGGGAHGKRAGINMLTTIAVAATDEAERATVAPPPPGAHAGMWAAMKQHVERVYRPGIELENVRSARTVRAGDFVFTVGAVGHINPATGARAPVLADGSFQAQVRNSYEELRQHLAPANISLKDLVRLDAPLRDGHNVPDMSRFTRSAWRPRHPTRRI